MSQVSPECVAGYAAAAGFTGNDLITAVAVAKQESGFRSDAANSCCVGLWQINLKAHGVTAAQMKIPMLNAQTAYKIFKESGGWCTSGHVPNCNPWQGYGVNQPGSSWASALKTGQNAVASLIAKGIAMDVLTGKSSSDVQVILKSKGLDCVGMAVLGDPSAGGNPIGNPLNSAAAMIQAFNRMGSWITNPDNLMRIVKVALGGIVLVVGTAALMDKEVGSMVPGVNPAKLIKAIK